MSTRSRVAVPAVFCLAVVVLAVLVPGDLARIGSGAGRPGLAETPSPQASDGAAIGSLPPQPTPTPVPAVGGTELYGYLPYWEMTDTMATYLRGVPVSTLALFSVSAKKSGALNTGQLAYRRISGTIGSQLIREAHQRGTTVDLVFTSFGYDRNAQFFGRSVAAPASPEPAGPTESAAATSPGASPTIAPAPWTRTVEQLVGLTASLHLDGINVDVELLDAADRAAYGDFLASLGSALHQALPKAHLSAATQASTGGALNAATAIGAGVDRVFLMGYDYHWSGSQPGGSAPIDRSDLGYMSLRWSIDQYVSAGVPRDRILLGLPLYGMSWVTLGPSRNFYVLEKGTSWIPSQHVDLLSDPSFSPSRDPKEWTEYFMVPESGGWRITYYDSPATLRGKLALALDSGLAGAGFWALGYERGLPGYDQLMAAFRAGKVSRDEVPPAVAALP
jgi:Glycosyl hydrolases family 18